MCFKQKEEGTCLGTPLTVADAAYVFSSGQLSTPEEGKANIAPYVTNSCNWV